MKLKPLSTRDACRIAGINDLYDVEKYDVSAVLKFAGIMEDIVAGKRDHKFSREDAFYTLVFSYAADFYYSGEGCENMVSFDSSDDSNYAFAGSLAKMIVLSQHSQSVPDNEKDSNILKKLASYLYIRAYNRFKSEGILMSVKVDRNCRILNVWDSESDSICSIDTFDLAESILNNSFSSEDMVATDEDKPLGDEDDPEIEEKTTVEDSEDTDDTGIFFGIGVPIIDEMLTNAMNEHKPEVQDCHKICETYFGKRLS